MKEKMKLLNDIDAAIDEMNEEKINMGLDALRAMEEDPLSVEDPGLFAARIIALERSGKNMIRHKKYFKPVLAAAMIAAMALTAYAATTMNLFSFGKGDRYVTVRTTNEMSEDEANTFADQNLQPGDQAGATLQADTEEYSFDTVAEAAQKLDMVIPIPSAMPEMQLESVHASVTSFGEASESRMVWTQYSDDEGRMFGLTVGREVLGGDDTTFTASDMDPGSLGSYKSSSGVEFATLTESNDDGSMTAHIATVMIGEYEYSMVFVGFDQGQREAIIDSADLSAYVK